MINKMSRRQILMYVGLALVFGLVFMCMKPAAPAPVPAAEKFRNRVRRNVKSRYQPNGKMAAAPVAGVEGVDIDSIDQMYAPTDVENSNMDMQKSCAAAGGVGLASSLLPREAASQENFGEFAPQDILKGQSFLSTREKVGMPETIGGALRNANQQIRAEPPNPKKAYVWHNSTIAPDTMQRPLI